MTQKESKGVFIPCFMSGCCLVFLYAHTHRWRRCPAVLLAAWKSIACMQINSPCHALTQIYMRHTTHYSLPEFNSSWAEKQLHKLEKHTGDWLATNYINTPLPPTAIKMSVLSTFVTSRISEWE